MKVTPIKNRLHRGRKVVYFQDVKHTTKQTPIKNAFNHGKEIVYFNA